MQRLRRWASAAVYGGAFAAGVLAVGAALAFCPGRAWLLRGALYLQDPAAAAALDWPAAPAQSVSSPQRPESRPTPLPTPCPAPAPSATPQPSAAPTATPLPSAAPELADAGRIRAVQLRQGSGTGYLQLAAGSIKNSTEHPDSDLRAAVTTPSLPFSIERDSAAPQVLIMHTHATESYQLWPDPVYDKSYAARSRNTALNVCAVGAEMARVLNEAGINTLHDTTLYDAPGYTDSYKRSRAGVQEYLARYPSIKVVLDVHRDAIEDADGTRVKPVWVQDGESTAQVMVIAGCDNGGSIALPNWRLNLRLAAAWEAAMEESHPGLTRPVLCGYRFYNQDLTTGSLLIEVGGHANTLDEAIRAGRYAAEGLAKIL
ncbi:MAG: stage II sporulation protein P [Gemmiger sp.]|uniref:stage II sporulation protein P n=1 Tax=Gemmiger sp. TaxID=2049027 RepID=UPI002E78E881|nr:stage II sporulation protein P [Gemmiger sp.]MEE0098749.1 stage II sporulation protein P [Gemmiger sp.]